ncbi:bifunctional hydroxymethylpyrimidine kinase/phosphomethylpyrimidine kinase [Candidatus Phycosocius spiralis]|uniref:hydroxymethylpyrimidine kinase n=1 Tax=Candidatus Phycosocius spiralis TaxID=2815099 RepID=A0ABQ4PVM9_9PROT|nr:bifunctional hydroxymethylpyrimidine kinase/phosphomethylpyrimidine kinase [Candidatus Phycosocius spiralis]GIU67087.1 hydroxymethylpyrimidine/phosphomethylpyrimidine kinase [Candidatus Phycosocius spiralis]
MTNSPKGRVLIIAGSDSGGGAGIQGDIKAVTALGGFAMTAVTAITVQNTMGVFDVHPVPLPIITDQIACVTRDLGLDAVKTGMLGNVEIVEGVAEALQTYTKGAPRVIDPVMIAKSGHPLLEARAIGAVKSLMIPLASLLTPNAPEAERLTDLSVDGINGQRRAAERLLRLGASGVLVKGGHIAGTTFSDVLATHKGEVFFETQRMNTTSTHGTGCTLASAIAAHLSQGVELEEAVERARAYLLQAMLTAPGFGKGHGPLNHAWPVQN